ncbi:spherulation-specific family 4 protein [Streptacidiphilus carbonis]|uniref:spherulation-specific family 4 protein n=1 Tax=Streptacidiphilus carbonis TaxID=105422 RepID=UPI001F21BE4D|nr:spherulation-specific family 4 protein [Streptacidiphilus carbonis]
MSTTVETVETAEGNAGADMDEHRLLVPLYVYPGAWAETETRAGSGLRAWEAVASHAAEVAWVVFNPASGPGAERLPEFAEAARLLRAAGVSLLGYVDTDYARRAHHQVVEDLERYQEWYPVDGVFLDQVRTERELLPHYRRLAVAARALDAPQVVLNPGTHPDPGYAEVADVVVTFEGDWAAHRELLVPEWTADFPDRRFAHLVHGAPPGRCGEVRDTAPAHGAGYSYATTGSGDNPWSVLMDTLLEPVAQVSR